MPGTELALKNLQNKVNTVARQGLCHGQYWQELQWGCRSITSTLHREQQALEIGSSHHYPLLCSILTVHTPVPIATAP